MAKRFGETVAALRRGETLHTAWSSIPSRDVAGELVRGGFPTVTLDMQHGGHDFASVREGIEAVVSAGGAAGVRVPVDAPFEISRVLDCGAEYVIVPMVNTAEDARRAVAFARFPPVGERSWGPHGATVLHGYDDPNAYLAEANGRTALLVMVETAEAVANLDAILAVEGIDGVFVGPSDLSISLSRGAALAPRTPETLATATQIAARARAAGRFSALFTFDADHAGEARAAGFGLIALGTDRSLVRRAAANLLSAVS